MQPHFSDIIKNNNPMVSMHHIKYSIHFIWVIPHTTELYLLHAMYMNPASTNT